MNVCFQVKLAKKGKMLGGDDYAAQEILLDPTFTVAPTVDQAYLHELVHCILFIMGENELCNTEKNYGCLCPFFLSGNDDC